MAWGPGRAALRDSGRRLARRRRSRLASAESRRAQPANTARARVEGAVALRLAAGAARTLRSAGREARLSANPAARASVRPASAGQRGRRRGWAALSGERVDLRRVQRAGSSERDHPLAAARRHRPASRRPRAEESVRSRGSAGDEQALRLGQRAGRAGDRGPARARRDGRHRAARCLLRLATLLAELRAQADGRPLPGRDAAGGVPRAALVGGRHRVLHRRLRSRRPTAAISSSRCGASTTRRGTGGASSASTSCRTGSRGAWSISPEVSITRWRCSSTRTAACWSQTGAAA